ncbi:MAG: AAA family ATPase, partial [Planctomycetota bacterium]
MQYFHLAASYVMPPSLILLCGLPGSGKSWAAQHIARPFEALVIRSDVVRKRLAGVPPTYRATGAEAEALYSDQSSRRTFAAMQEEAECRLGEGRTVVLDATFAQRRARDPFIDMARSARVPFVVVHVTCPAPVIAERMRDRASDAEEVSDADWSIYEQFKPNFEPPDELPPPHSPHSPHRVDADSTEEPELIVSDVIDALVEQVSGSGGMG